MSKIFLCPPAPPPSCAVFLSGAARGEEGLGSLDGLCHGVQLCGRKKITGKARKGVVGIYLFGLELGIHYFT